MKTCIPLSIILLSSFINGCQKTQWVALDNTPAADAELRQARQACRIDKKLATLEQARSDSAESLRKASSNEAKMLVRDDIQMRERSINDEIEACMSQQGFKQKS